MKLLCFPPSASFFKQILSLYYLKLRFSRHGFFELPVSWAISSLRQRHLSLVQIHSFVSASWALWSWPNASSLCCASSFPALNPELGRISIAHEWDTQACWQGIEQPQTVFLHANARFNDGMSEHFKNLPMTNTMHHGQGLRAVLTAYIRYEPCIANLTKIYKNKYSICAISFQHLTSICFILSKTRGLD